MRLAILLAIAGSLCAPTSALSADSADDLSTMRRRSGAYLGLGLITGQLKFKSATVESDIVVNALPAVVGGIDLWPEEHIGLYADFHVGTGAEIADLGGQAVDLNTADYQLGARYRWFLGPKATAMALGAGLGVHGFNQFVRDQRPSVLLDRAIIGPQLSGFTTVPLMRGRLWIRGTVVIELPFFVRETPKDSGNPSAFFGYGAQVEAVLAIAGRWSVQVDLDYSRRDLDFDGLATRGAGTRDGSANDGFMRYGISARFAGL